MQRPLTYPSAIGLVLVAQAVVLLCVLIGGEIRGEPLDSWSLALVHLIAFGTAIWVGLRDLGDVPARDVLGVRLVRPSTLVSVLSLGVGTALLLLELGSWVEQGFPPGREEAREAARLLEPGQPVGMAGTFAFVLVAVPIAEELFFRGLLQRRLAERYGRRLAIAFTAGAFTLAHLDPRLFPEALVAGLALGWIADRTGSTLASVVVHSLCNAAALLAAAPVLRPAWSVLRAVGGGPCHVRPALLVVAAALAVVGGLALRRPSHSVAT